MRKTCFRTYAGIAILAAICLAGCTVKVAPPAAATPKAKATTAATPAGPEIKLHRIDKVGYDAMVGHYAGKVVLVDFWATWCPKCREDFRHTIALERKYGPQGLVVVSLACDDAEKTDEIMSFLREQEATIHNLRGVDGADEKTFEDFQIDGGALPHYKLYDRKGELRKTFAIDPDKDTQFSLADIDAAVEELLAEDKKPANAEEAAANLTSPTDAAKRHFGNFLCQFFDVSRFPSVPGGQILGIAV
ncbi:MAG: TlpA family protein disulfide reductase [Deltaproteobacteria bacterium]